MTTQLIDNNGNIIPGFTRDCNGAIKVNDPGKYKYYQNQKFIFDTINNHENKINEINMKLDSIIKLLSRDNNHHG
jgi:hypothetical protein